MDLSLSCSTSRLEAADSRPERAELSIDIICIMSQLTNLDIPLGFSVHRVQQLCRTLTKHWIYCNFMATAFENLVKHLKLAIRQLEELRSTKKSIADACRAQAAFKMYVEPVAVTREDVINVYFAQPETLRSEGVDFVHEPQSVTVCTCLQHLCPWVTCLGLVPV